MEGGAWLHEEMQVVHRRERVHRALIDETPVRHTCMCVHTIHHYLHTQCLASNDNRCDAVLCHVRDVSSLELLQSDEINNDQQGASNTTKYLVSRLDHLVCLGKIDPQLQSMAGLCNGDRYRIREKLN